MSKYGFKLEATGDDLNDPEIMEAFTRLMYLIAHKRGLVPEMINQMLEWPNLNDGQKQALSYNLTVYMANNPK